MNAVNPSNWTGIEEFTSWDAACILCDVEPFDPIRENPAPRSVKAMQTRIATELKPCRDTSRTEHRPTYRVMEYPRRSEYQTVTIQGTRYYSRTDLEAFADKLGLRFLSDEHQEPEADEIRGDLKENLLVLFGILAEMYAEKAGTGLRNGDRINQKALHGAMTEYAKAHKITAGILGSTQFNERLKEALSLLR